MGEKIKAEGVAGTVDATRARASESVGENILTEGVASGIDASTRPSWKIFSPTA